MFLGVHLEAQASLPRVFRSLIQCVGDSAPCFSWLVTLCYCVSQDASCSSDGAADGEAGSAASTPCTNTAKENTQSELKYSGGKKRNHHPKKKKKSLKSKRVHLMVL